MIENVVIEPMSERMLLWRCLQDGSLTVESIEQWSPDSATPWMELRARNVPLLAKLTATYGSCAMLARDNEQVVGMLRFYPKAITLLEEAGQLCLQQDYPAGPMATLVERRFPPLAELADKTLVVHCLMTGSPSRQENPYQRRGIGTRLALGLTAWAREQGWQAIEATAYESLPIVYAVTGQTGRSFWERLGFGVAALGVEPALAQSGDFSQTMRQQAVERGLAPESITNCYTMRLDIGSTMP